MTAPALSPPQPNEAEVKLIGHRLNMTEKALENSVGPAISRLESSISTLSTQMAVLSQTVDALKQTVNERKSDAQKWIFAAIATGSTVMGAIIKSLFDLATK